jgi:FkbM family methyltransferase
VTGLKKISAAVFLATWPVVWPVIRAVNRLVPREGRIRQGFNRIVFQQFWDRWYRNAYDSDYRDKFFESILTFFYDYPVRKGDTIVQIGASFGEETARFARAVGKTGRVFAIEPETRNVEIQRSLLPYRKYPQITMIQVAVSNITGKVDLFVGGGKEHRLSDIPARELTYEWWGVVDHLQQSRYRRAEPVEVDTLDNILRPYALQKIDFVLVETNGNELESVKGMNEILPAIRHIGARGHVMRDGVPTYIAIEDELKKKGFKTRVTSEGMVLGRRPETSGVA